MSDPAVIPTAAPAAPVASVVPSPAAQAAAVAPAEPAAPAAPAEPVALVPDPAAAPAVPIAAPVALVPDPEPTNDAKWYLAKDVPGTGDAPDFFKGDKYESIFEQAKAYPELEKRFGAFTGSPKDGVYAINVPDDVPVQFDPSHSLFQELNKWATDSQLSQGGYDSVISMFARYEASLAPDMNAIKTELGDDADARLSSVAQWAKSNLSSELYKSFRNAQTQSNAADTFKVIEAIIGKTRQVAMPKPGDDVPAATLTGLEEINSMQTELVKEGSDKGRRRYTVDSAFREKVEKLRFQHMAAQVPKV